MLCLQNQIFNMLTAFARDSSLQHSLVAFLTLVDIAALHRSCRSWRRWLEKPTGSASRSQARHVTTTVPHQLDQLLHSRWALPLLDSLEVTVFDRDAPFHEPGYAQQTAIIRGAPNSVSQGWHQLLSSLTLNSFPRLQHLHICFMEDSSNVLDPLLLQEAFTVLGSRLQSLHLLSVNREQFFSPAPTLAMLASLHLLTSLTSLIIHDSQQWHAHLSHDPSAFERLPALTKLHCASRFACEVPLEAFDSLARCKRLTDLHYSFQCSIAEWEKRGELHWSQIHAKRAAHFEATLGRLITLRLLLQSDGTVEPLQIIRFEDMEMTPDLWAVLTRLPSLTEIKPKHWEPAIEAQCWQSGFQSVAASLQRLQLGGNMFFTFNVDDSVAPFQALRCCTRLKELSLTLMVLPTEVLEGLVDSLQLLESLSLTRMQLGSLAALSRLSSLSHLQLVLCASLLQQRASMPESWLDELPSMPALRSLNIGPEQQLHALWSVWWGDLKTKAPLLAVDAVKVLTDH